VKGIAYLLLFSVLTLSVQPAVTPFRAVHPSVAAASGHSCCSKKKAAVPRKTPVPMNCCTNGFCNPFGLCACCFVPVTPATTLQDNIFDITGLQGHPVSNPVLSNCYFASFHPPEAV